MDEVDRFTFYIQDNGMGIAPEHFDRVFKLFQKLDDDKRRDSSGIGLAVVKKIVSKNGGEIWLKSKEGEGTSFFFSFSLPTPRDKLKFPLELPKQGVLKAYTFRA